MSFSLLFVHGLLSFTTLICVVCCAWWCVLYLGDLCGVFLFLVMLTIHANVLVLSSLRYFSHGYVINDGTVVCLWLKS